MTNANETLTTSNPNIVASFETSEVTDNIILDGLMLRITMTKNTFKVFRKVHFRTRKPEKFLSKNLVNKETKTINLKLSEISLDKLSDFRNQHVPSFVLKIGEKLYHTIIPNNVYFVSSNILGKHQCSCKRYLCRRLSSASDSDGGCEKVRNFSQCIENYPWILTGYETFNTKSNTFIVIKCLHCQKIKLSREK
jgi:hypothetical protein